MEENFSLPTDVEIGFISALLTTKDFQSVLERDVTPDLFESSIREIFVFICGFRKEYHCLPTHEFIKNKFGILFDNDKLNVNSYIDELFNKKLFNNLDHLIRELNTDLSNDKVKEAFEKVTLFARSNLYLGDLGIVIHDIKSRAEDLAKKYLDAEAGMSGIKLPWQTMQNWTNGFLPGDVSFLVARQGQGKSWLAVLLSVHFAQQGKTVLFLSGEMSVDDIFMRVIARELKLNYGKLRKGKLDPEIRGEFLAFLEVVKNLDNIKTVEFSAKGKDRGITYNGIQLAIERVQPAIVIADSCYRFKPSRPARDRFESMAIIADDLKELAMSNGIPFFATTQLNRGAAKKKVGKNGGKPDVGAEDIAMTDVIGWVATNIFYILRPETDKGKKLKKLYMYPLKIREGELSEERMSINWDFDTMDFSEIEFEFAEQAGENKDWINQAFTSPYGKGKPVGEKSIEELSHDF